MSLPPEDAVVLPVELEALPLVAGAGLVELLALPGRVEELAVSALVAAHPSFLEVTAFDVNLLGVFVVILLCLLHGFLKELVVLDHPGNLSFCFGLFNCEMFNLLNQFCILCFYFFQFLLCFCGFYSSFHRFCFVKVFKQLLHDLFLSVKLFFSLVFGIIQHVDSSLKNDIFLFLSIVLFLNLFKF